MIQYTGAEPLTTAEVEVEVEGDSIVVPMHVVKGRFADGEVTCAAKEHCPVKGLTDLVLVGVFMHFIDRPGCDA